VAKGEDMKKRIPIAVIAFMVVLQATVAAQDDALSAMKSQIYAESKEIKPLLAGTKDPVLVSSMWDSCLVAITQLDAYFHMLNIFGTIKKRDLTENAADSLLEWLNTIKDTNTLNIKSLSERQKIREPETELHVDRLMRLYKDLNRQIEFEIKRVSAVKESIRLR
jgi:hypothetical protein